MAADGEIDVVLVEWKDPLARLAFTYLVEVFAAHGVRFEVLEGPVAMNAAQELVANMRTIATR